jgi:hypothetical protein
MTQLLKLGDRYFTAVTETTARQDGWMLGVVMDAGIVDMIGKKADETSTLRLVVQLYRSGKVAHVLAGSYVEQDMAWSIESAEANAEYFANVTDPAEKAALADALIPALMGFFHSALSSLPASPSVSTGPVAPKPERKRRAASSTAHVQAVSGGP